MSDNRYSELKYDGKIYTAQWQIDEILIKNKFNWMIDAEIKNARLEIFQDTLVWNAGIWYNGDWYFGVWRDGEWRYGTWQNGVWYNGTWRDGTFKSGIIYKGRFFKGKMLNGEIRGGQFIDMEIDSKVIEYTGDEYQAKKQAQVEQPSASGQTTTVTAKATMQPTGQTSAQSVIQVQPEDRVKVSGTKPPVQKLQQENNKYNMKKIKNYADFISEGLKPEQGFDDVANYSGFGTKILDFVDGSTFTFHDFAFEGDNIVLIGTLELSEKYTTPNKLIENYNMLLINHDGNVELKDKTNRIKSLPTRDTTDQLKYIYKHAYDILIEKGDDAQYNIVRNKYHK
jgi:hypothetical protein